MKKSWAMHAKKEMQKESFVNLMKFLEKEFSEHTCYPDPDNIFRAFDFFELNETRVVVIAQDPYHNGLATGLAFGGTEGGKLPALLRTIFEEIRNDLDEYPKDITLESWARQGVLLINTNLTVKEGEPFSHAGKGWEQFTSAMCSLVNNLCTNIVWLVWGKKALAFYETIKVDKKRHKGLYASHPLPFSTSGFYNQNHFSKANYYLKQNGKKEIDWINIVK